MTGILLLATAVLYGEAAAIDSFNYRGHIKYQSVITNLPANSLLQDFSDDPAIDNNLDLRLNLSGRPGAWNWHADYQLQARRGDRLSLLQKNPGLGFASSSLPSDDHRVFDLTRVISEQDGSILAHRLDRLYLSHVTNYTVFIVGRQAVSWGNGLIYNPMDFFNPFDPAAIDTEYKTGDDMIYGQYLLESGDDLQAVWVGRRDDEHEVSNQVSSLALKYHGFSGNREYDLLIAEHYDQAVIALGGVTGWAQALWRSDIVISQTDAGNVTSAVINWSYSWIAASKNVSATVEYYHNGFGIDDGDYSPDNLVRHPELVARLLRGELFTLGVNYLSAAATVELTPLWLLTTSIFNNLDDGSSLVQFLSLHDLQQNLQLILAVDIPTGSDGTEFGGIDSAVPGRPLSVGPTFFAQLAWYF